MTEKGFLVGDVAVDYLTVSATVHYEMLREIAKREMDFSFWETPHRARRMQYEGITSGTSFYGETTKGRMMSLYQTSGIEAFNVYQSICDYERSMFKCTRIDVQITLELTSHISELWERLNGNKEQYRDVTGKLLNWSIIQNKNGLNTLYVGSRQSQLFRRFYIKEIAGKQYLRLEIEYKGDRANKVFQNKMGYKTLQIALLDGMMFLVSSDYQDMFDQIKLVVYTTEKGELLPLPEKPAVNLVWLREVVIPYIEKAYDYHPDYIRRLVTRLYNKVEYGINGDYDKVLDDIAEML